MHTTCSNDRMVRVEAEAMLLKAIYELLLFPVQKYIPAVSQRPLPNVVPIFRLRGAHRHEQFPVPAT